MIFLTRPAGFTVAILLVVGLSGCGNTPTKAGMPWYPQGPGNQDIVTAEEAAQEAAPRKDKQPASQAQQAPQRGPAQQPTLVPDLARYGDLLFVSGQIPDADVMGPLGEPATIEEETRAVMDKIRAILETQNLNMANIVNTTIYLVDAGDIAAMERVYDSYFRSARPASSIVEVRRLPRNARVQIAVVAGR